MTSVLASLAECPYCHASLPRPPTKEHTFSSCNNKFFVRRGQDSSLYAVTESELRSPPKGKPVPQEEKTNELTKLHYSLVTAMVNGKSPDELIEILAKRKVDKQLAEALVLTAAKDADNIKLQPAWRSSQRKKGIWKIAIGFLICGIGIASVIVAMTSTASGTYIIWWGAIISGFIYLTSGVDQTIKNWK